MGKGRKTVIVKIIWVTLQMRPLRECVKLMLLERDVMPIRYRRADTDREDTFSILIMQRPIMPRSEHTDL